MRYSRRGKAMSATLQDEEKTDAATLDEHCDWDEEAIAEAYARAEAIAEFDPEAAIQLRAQARAVERRPAYARDGGTTLAAYMGSREPYDPMKLYARMGMRYPWMTDEVIDRMHFPKFFAYVREAHILAEEEEAAYERARQKAAAHHPQQQQPSLSPEEASSLFPRAKIYEGEVTPYGR